MKILKLILLFNLFATGYLQAQWEVQLDIQNFTHLDRIFFLDENYGWAIGGTAIGAQSPYFYTTDSGENWYLSEDWWDIKGTDIVFVNYDTGFIASDQIYKTIDGGETWIEIQTPATQGIIHLFFVDENNGWATLGQFSEGNILHTEDSGETWELQNVIDTIFGGIEAIYFLNDSTGFAAGGAVIDEDYNIIAKTENKGEDWIVLKNFIYAPFWFQDIYFTDNFHGWIVGQKNITNSFLLMHSNDGGETWEEDTIPGLKNWFGGTAEATIIFSIQFLNDTLGWLTCADEDNSGYILLTTDGGENWEQQFVFYNPIFDICMVDNNNGWAVGEDIIYHTNNGDTIIITEINENKYEDNFFSIIPNPSSGYVIISYNLETEADCSIEIKDITGKSIQTLKTNGKQDQITVVTESWKAGVYIATLFIDGKSKESVKFTLVK
jgi:photosystem II stability/assembly factor-like uncharacterized protein